MTRQTLAAFTLASLWLAFAAVCAGLWLSGGRGPLTRAKLRLGGLILTIAGVSTALAVGCSCYEPMRVYDSDTAPPVPPCGDGADNDGDGWTDLSDPDCRSGDREEGFGTTACNDGIDNDQDGQTDNQDAGCEDGADDVESH